MRRSPSVHNALVLNLRSGDANLDVRRRSPPLAISFPMFLCLFLALRSPSRPAIITVSPLSPISFKLVSPRICSLYPSPFNPLSPLFLSHTRTHILVLRKLPTVLPLDWRFVTRNHTRWIIATSRRQGARRDFHVGDGIVSYTGTTTMKKTTTTTQRRWRRWGRPSYAKITVGGCSDLNSVMFHRFVSYIYIYILFWEQNLQYSRLTENSMGNFAVFWNRNLISRDTSPKYP